MILSHILSAATLAASAIASPLASREVANGPLIYCSGLQFPNYDDCEELVHSWKDNINVLHKSADKPKGSCVSVYHGRCEVGVCFNVDGYAEATYDELYGSYNLIKGDCKSKRAGGYFDLDDKKFTVDKYDPNSLLVTNQTGSSLQKRIDPNDDSFELIEQDDYVERPGYKTFISEQGDGVEYTVMKTDSKTVGVSVSVEVSASFLEIMSASIGTTIDTSETITNTVGYKITPKCNGRRGAIYWFPLWNHYHGKAKPSNEVIDVWIPVKQSADNYRVECLG